MHFLANKSFKRIAIHASPFILQSSILFDTRYVLFSYIQRPLPIVIEKLKELWVIPIWFVIVTASSMLVGSILGWLFRLRQSQRSFFHLIFSYIILSNIAQQELRYRSLHVYELQRSSNCSHAKSRRLGSRSQVGKR